MCGEAFTLTLIAGAVISASHTLALSVMQSIWMHLTPRKVKVFYLFIYLFIFIFYLFMAVININMGKGRGGSHLG